MAKEKLSGIYCIENKVNSKNILVKVIIFTQGGIITNIV